MDAGNVKPMRRKKTFTVPAKIHGYAQVLGIFTNSKAAPDVQNQGSSSSGSSETDGEEGSGCFDKEASIFLRWLGGMYEDGEADANVYERPVPVSRAIGHMKEIESPRKNPYQIFQAGQNAILAPVWLIPEPDKPGQYFAVKNDDKETWHQFGEAAAPATVCSSGLGDLPCNAGPTTEAEAVLSGRYQAIFRSLGDDISESDSDDEPLATWHAVASASVAVAVDKSSKRYQTCTETLSLIHI